MPRKQAVTSAIFVTKAEIARNLGVKDSASLDRWVADGRMPPPHSQPGPRHAVWLRKHWDAYVETGEWPKSAYPRY